MDAIGLSSLLGALLLLTGFAMWRLPVGECDQCPHCRLERLRVQQEVEDRARARDAESATALGVVRCDRCGRMDVHDHRDRG
jgi:hypothetical protein